MADFKNYQFYNFKGGLDFKNSAPLVEQSESKVAWADSYNVEFNNGTDQAVNAVPNMINLRGRVYDGYGLCDFKVEEDAERTKLFTKTVFLSTASNISLSLILPLSRSVYLT